MKRAILIPADNELLPDGSIIYQLPVMNKQVVDCIAPDDWIFYGTILYLEQPQGTVVTPLSEPRIHDFAGWGG